MSGTLSSRLTTGVLIILIGVLLLLSTTGAIETESVWVWLPLPFVLLGIWALVRSEFRNLTGPVMVIAIAGAFQLRNLGLIADGAIGTWWPLFVVLFGVLIAVSRSRRRTRVQLAENAGEPTIIGVFGSGNQRLATDRFTGAELVAVFGDAVVDLRETSVPLPPAVVETVSVFGDVEVRVPDDWAVRFDVLAVFGDVHDDRPRDSGGSTDTGEPDLVITGLAIFGDVEVRD